MDVRNFTKKFIEKNSYEESVALFEKQQYEDIFLNIVSIIPNVLSYEDIKFKNDLNLLNPKILHLIKLFVNDIIIKVCVKDINKLTRINFEFVYRKQYSDDIFFSSMFNVYVVEEIVLVRNIKSDSTDRLTTYKYFKTDSWDYVANLTDFITKNTNYLIDFIAEDIK